MTTINRNGCFKYFGVASEPLPEDDPIDLELELQVALGIPARKNTLETDKNDD